MRLFDSNWQNSPAHQLFLVTFLQPRKIDNIPDIPPQFPVDNWEDALEEDPLRTTERFQALGLITYSNLHIHIDQKFTKSELKGMLKQRNLAISGNKADVIARLAQADKESMNVAIGAFTLLECTIWGQTKIKQYWQNPQITDESNKLSSNILLGAAKWILGAVGAGVIGNRANNAVTAIYQLLQQQTVPLTIQPTATLQPSNTPKSTSTPQPTQTPKPTNTQQPTRTPKSNTPQPQATDTPKHGLITNLQGYGSKEELRGKKPKYNYLKRGIIIKNLTNQMATLSISLKDADTDNVIHTVNGTLSPREQKTFKVNHHNIPKGRAVYAVISSDVKIESNKGFLSFLDL